MRQFVVTSFNGGGITLQSKNNWQFTQKWAGNTGKYDRKAIILESLRTDKSPVEIIAWFDYMKIQVYDIVDPAWQSRRGYCWSGNDIIAREVTNSFIERIEENLQILLLQPQLQPLRLLCVRHSRSKDRSEIS